MARNLKANAAFLNQLLDGGIQTLFDSGFLNMRAAPQPADASLTETGTLLATLAIPADSLDPASGGVLLSASVWSTLNALATGNAAWFRLKDVGDTYRLDGTVGASGETQASGTATGGAASYLTNAAAGLAEDAHRGRDIIISTGTGAGQRRVVATNNSTQFFVTKVWDTIPDATSVYRVDEAYDLRVTTTGLVLNEPYQLNSASFDLSCLL